MTATFVVGSDRVGGDAPCFIIAEGGLNHNGDLAVALRLADEAKRIGVNAIKFQMRTIQRILTKAARARPYTGENSYGATYGEHRERLELSQKDWRRLFDHCREIGILCFGSPWDEESADRLADMGAPLFKIASADLTNTPLLEHVANKGRPMIVSTGMSSSDEVDAAVGRVLAHNAELALLHCVSVYPFEADLANLRVIPAMAQRYPQVVPGYSGHEKSGLVVSLAAVTLGAKVLERHFTLDRTMKGPDHAASLEPGGFAQLVEDVRKVEEALGDGIKRVLPGEVAVREKLGKSVTAAVDIRRGTPIKRDMLVMKSPGTGLTGHQLAALVGRVAQRDLREDDQFPVDALGWPVG